MRKGTLKEDYRLVTVTDEYYRDITPEGQLELPVLLSFSEFSAGKEGKLLYSISKEKFVFGPEKFYEMFKKSDKSTTSNHFLR